MKRYMKNRNQFLQISKQIIYPSRILLFFLVTSLTLFSCDKFLQENPKDKLPEEDVYNRISEVYLNAVASLYTYIGGYSDSQGLQGTGRGLPCICPLCGSHTIQRQTDPRFRKNSGQKTAIRAGKFHLQWQQYYK